MTDHALLGPWVRRLLLEYLVQERNLSIKLETAVADVQNG